MATFTTTISEDFSAASDDLEIGDDGALAFLNSTSIGIDNLDGTAFVLKGSFQISNGEITGGTVTGLEYGDTALLSGGAHQTYENFTGANADLVTIANLYASGGSDLDFANYMMRDNDNVTGSSFNDTLWGFNGDDVVNGANGNDFVQGNQGNDTVYGGLGNDEVYGGRGDDQVIGNEGNDSMNGNIGNDILTGLSGDDFMFGGQNNDVLSGGEGTDTISGDRGDDTLTGGAGADNFLFNPVGGNDRVTDFTHGVDHLVVSAAYGMTADQVVAASIAVEGLTQITFAPGASVLLDGFMGLTASDILIA